MEDNWEPPFPRNDLDTECSAISILSSPLSTPGSLSPSPPTSPARSEEARFISAVSVYGEEKFTSSLLFRRSGGFKNLSIDIPNKPKDSRSSKSAIVRETLDEIEEKQNTFFVMEKDLILPLLPEENSIRDLIDSDKYRNARIQHLEPLKYQPAGLRAELKPYQLEGLSFLLHLKNNGVGGILGDEMGLGKTIQTLSLFLHIRETEDIQCTICPPFLVICPLSVLDNWVSEVTKWTPGLNATKFHGSQAEKAQIKSFIAAKKAGKGHVESKPMPDIILTTFDTLLSDRAWFSRVFVWKYVVLDEGHRIKNSESKRAQALRAIKSEFKLVLTGTPVQNNLRELWSLFNWLYPNIFVPSTSEVFEQAFSLGEGRVDREFLEHAKRFLGLVMLRREKDSAEIGITIPSKTEITLSVPLSDLQHSWYLKALTGIDQMSYGDLRKPGSTSYNRAIGNILMELRKCSIHPYMLDDALPDPYEPGDHIAINSGKFVVLQKLVEQFVFMDKKKVIIFSGFDQALNICEDLFFTLKENGLRFEYVRLDGKTSRAWRNLNIHLFNSDERYRIFLISTRAGGEGINLTSASTVVFLDEDWNPQAMRQAEARVHRIGQTQPVTVFRLYSRGTVEEQIRCRVDKKVYLASKVTDSVQSPCVDTPFSPGGVRNTNCADTTTTNGSLVASLRRAAFSGNHLDTKYLTSLDWETLLKKCTNNQKPDEGLLGPIMTDEDEEAWLRRVEKVKTNIFQGLKIDTTARSSPKVQENPDLGLARAERRIGKKRTVKIDGYDVLRSDLRQPVPMTKDQGKNDTTVEFVHEIVSLNTHS
ncbi:hypothetical protein MW887_002393 [Aspergillus wentii]|nr:hypothetical protein MW887_002393 [Aspergillus wentii]